MMEAVGTIPAQKATESVLRAGGDVPAMLQRLIVHHLRYTLATSAATASRNQCYQALVHALRDFLVDYWIHSQRLADQGAAKQVCYLSAEFHIGRLLDTVLTNLRLTDACRKAVEALGFHLDELNELESDFGLGAGGLGRLAACYLDSMATLGMSAFGYGIRYEYGIFFQKIENGTQVETPDNWLRYGNAWEVVRPECIYPVRYYGKIRRRSGSGAHAPHEWNDTQLVIALGHDVPIPGYGSGTVCTLRTWAARSSRDFDMNYFIHGQYDRAIEDKNRTENICRILYPPDDIPVGRELRLKQEYFLVSASLQDILQRYKKTHSSFDAFPERVAIQLNDTHPALAIPELMRLFVDQEGLDWETAWPLCQATFGYTNHTIMPEALEHWPVELLNHVLPRHMQIIFEINHRFLTDVGRRYPNAPDRLRRLSLIDESNGQQVRMAHLAIVGSHAINGVSAMHSELLRRKVFPDFCDLYPERFSNKTNGITPRLWLKRSNPGLAELISRTIGDQWVKNLDDLQKLTPLADDVQFHTAWAAVKLANKAKLAEYIHLTQGLIVSPEAMFDCHAKRIHEYKRQVLNILHVIHLYLQLKDSPASPIGPRVVLFAGKAAPSYRIAKLIIRLIHAVAAVVNGDVDVGEQLRVVFLPNFRISLAQKVIPAVDLSEQISTAGTEASGTGNMKLALNGALTIGSLDGANVELLEALGPDSVYIFGHTAAEIEDLKRRGYSPRERYAANADLRRVLDALRQGLFSPGQPDLFAPIVDSLLDGGDPFFVLADFPSYVACQQRLSRLFAERDAWIRQSILTVARMGRFSSDRSIREYATGIWGVEMGAE